MLPTAIRIAAVIGSGPAESITRYVFPWDDIAEDVGIPNVASAIAIGVVIPLLTEITEFLAANPGENLFATPTANWNALAATPPPTVTTTAQPNILRVQT